MRISFFLYHAGNPIDELNPAWNDPIPQSRKNDALNASVSVSHGDYFEAVRRYLEKNEFEILITGASRLLEKEIQPGGIGEIRVIIEKHGLFYHPSRIQTIMHDDSVMSFALNVAVSEPGKSYIDNEYGLLNRLNDEFEHERIPRVFGAGSVETEKNGEFRMFLCEWFDGFSEFHISSHPDGGRKIKVWDAETGGYFLDDSETADVYRQASMILACYYNPMTFEQIFPWHHGAGDFVIKKGENGIEARLITVRGYSSLAGDGANDDSEAVFGAMLLFLLNMSIKMRIDRKDGTGGIEWAGNEAVAATIDGFFLGIGKNLPEAFTGHFRSYLSSCSEADLLDLMRAVVQPYHPEAPELPVIIRNIEEHAAIFHTVSSRV